MNFWTQAVPLPFVQKAAPEWTKDKYLFAYHESQNNSLKLCGKQLSNLAMW